ncbi:MAG: hypothetical protein ACXAC8_11580 [Candidatus Hodarchaeales archaeon]
MVITLLSKDEIKEFQEEYIALDVEDYSGLFQLVRKLVRDFLGRTKPYTLLGLEERGYNRGNFVGGYHLVGTNMIILNKSALRVMKEESPPDHYKAYLFHLLLHEYIHASGETDEKKTRQLTRAISLELFDTRHPVGRICVMGLGSLFPYSFHEERYTPSREELMNPEFVLLRHPDSELTYI